MPWQRWVKRYATDPETLDEEFPHAAAWFKRLSERPSVRKAFRDQDKAIEKAEKEKTAI
jgi:glutathione S-transferase